MRIANNNGRAAFMTAETNGVLVDVADISDGILPSSMVELFSVWTAVEDWYAAYFERVHAAAATAPRMQPALLGAPSPQPGQVFAVGLNYTEHAREAGAQIPEEPVVFTKFASCFAGPECDVTLPADAHVDWEIELVVVIGRAGRDIPAARAWQHVAGLTVGQDLSDRIRQQRGPNPQVSLCKSFRGFGPQGPALVTADELGDLTQLQLVCTLNDEVVQQGRLDGLIFSIDDLIHRLSAITELRPGDVIFTGTPGGTGLGRQPQRFLRSGDTLTSRIPGIGEIRQTFRAPVS